MALLELFSVAAVTNLQTGQTEVGSSYMCDRASECERAKLLGPTTSQNVSVILCRFMKSVSARLLGQEDFSRKRDFSLSFSGVKEDLVSSAQFNSHNDGILNL